VSGGVNANAERIDIGADVVGRDKIVNVINYNSSSEAIPSKPKVYHNLPQPDYVHFVGREAELAKLRSLLSPDERAWVVVINGIGGIGKSSLALEIAHEYLNCVDQLPEQERFKAIVWTSAKALTLTADGPAPRQQITHTLSDIYTAMAMALQREDITHARPEEQTALIRQALIQQRTLLIIDNMETIDDDKVNAFLRELPVPTKSIVTTRHRIDVAYPMSLVGMESKDAHALIAQECLKKNVELNEHDTQHLYDRTGGVPLALVWSIAQMGYGYSVSAVLTRLGLPNDDVAQFCFEAAVASIRDSPAYQLLLALSLFATDASRDALGEIAALPELDRDDGLVMLEKLSLISKSGRRFRMLPLTQIYSRAQLANESNTELKLRDRWLQWLLDLLSDTVTWQAQKFEAVRPDLQNIMAAIEHCSQVGDWETCRTLVQRADMHLWHMGTLNSLENYYYLIVENAVQQEQPRVQAQFLRRLANLHELRDELDKAQDEATRAVSLDIVHGEEKELVRALYNLSAVQLKNGQYDSARQSAETACELAMKQGDLRHAVRNQCQLAKIAICEGNMDSADGILTAALQQADQFEKTGDDDWILSTLYRLMGEVAVSRRDYQSAERYYQLGLDAARGLGMRTMEIRAMCRMAELAAVTGDTIQARAMARAASELCTRFGMEKESATMKDLLERMSILTAEA
jgi:tetratricopeptide (TPR) repeat protein